MRQRLLLAAVCAAASQAWGAGYLDHLRGQPYRWSFPIRYKLDLPPLGGIADPRSLVTQVLQIWQNVPEATVSFEDAGDLPADVTAANVSEYMALTAGAPRTVGDETIVIYDTDGAILTSIFGSSQGILGLASPGKLNDASLAITTGVAILNGQSAEEARVKATMVHEFGHMLNLAHTQANADILLSDPEANAIYLPTMFWALIEGNEQAMLDLAPDDVFSLAYLYPSAAFASRGTIRGRVVRRNGEGVRAVNVTCRSTSDPLFDVVSWLSDVQYVGDGRYLCGNLNTASYTVSIDPVYGPINVYDPYPPFVLSESYSGTAESFDPEVDGADSSVAVAVTAGAETADVNIVLNEDGRLVSGRAVSGTSRAFLPEMGYFITVPPGVKKATFKLETASNADLDINGRCNKEFSRAFENGTAPPIVAGAGETQQAEFATESRSGNETVVLDDKSAPKLRNCTYHLLVTNYSQQSADFTFTATLEGGSPRFRIRKGSAVTVNDGIGEITVLSRSVETEQETFRLRGLVVTDEGSGDLGSVAQATLYEDLDRNGVVTSADRLVAGAAEIDAASRRISFAGLDEFFEEGSNRPFLVTYRVSASPAGWGWLGAILVAGLIGGLRRSRWAPFVTVGLAIFLGSCGSKKPFEPTIRGREDVSVTGQTYGTDITVSIEGSYSSVDDFFRQ